MGLSYPPEQKHGTSTTKVRVSLAWRKEVYAIMFHWSVQLAESAVTMYGLYGIASLQLGVYGNGTMYTQYGAHLSRDGPYKLVDSYKLVYYSLIPRSLTSGLGMRLRIVTCT